MSSEDVGPTVIRIGEPIISPPDFRSGLFPHPVRRQLPKKPMMGTRKISQVSISSTFTRAFFVRNFGAKAET